MLAHLFRLHLHIHIHMHMAIDTAIHNKTARAFKEKGLLVEEEILVEPVQEQIEVQLTLARWQDMEQTAEMAETVETEDMMVMMVMQGTGDRGTDGRAGIAGTICVLVNPDIVIPSHVPISYVMSRPNWNNAIINPLQHLR